MLNPQAAVNEMARRREFVSQGMETARLLGRFAGDGVCRCRDRYLRGAGQGLTAVGQWLRQKVRLDSARS